MVAFGDKPILEVNTVEEWEQWILETGHPDGVRLRLRKKKSTAPGITYDEALEVALCHGWIDGQIGKFDDNYTLQSFTPRRARGPWSQRNRDIVERLEACGRMRDGGRAEIDRARADGRWDAAYRQKDAPVPADLQAALDAHPAASEFFATVSAQNRWAILFRLMGIKGADTRANKITTFIEMLERGETIY
ncbi:MAG: YdeI/OmpD-associated family protein [Rhodoglobus sp.]